MKRIKNTMIILLFLSGLIIFPSYQQVYTRDQCNDALNDKKAIFLHSAGYWNLTGTKIYINDLDSTRDWENITTEDDWCTGNGTIDNPYVIQDVELDGLGSGICIEIRNSRVFFIIENCSLSNAEIGIKIENCTNFKIINNKISDLKGKVGLDGINGNPGENGENGMEVFGIYINNCINVLLSSNIITNITGGNGGNGGDGDLGSLYGQDGGNGGNGSNAYGLMINDVKDFGIYENNITKIIAGKGGSGGMGSVGLFTNGEDGEFGLDGLSKGIEIKNTNDNFIVKSCNLSFMDCGLKIINSSNFEIKFNTILNIKGSEILSDLESSNGINKEQGIERFGVSINDCIEFNISSNKICNITGGRGRDCIEIVDEWINGGNGGQAGGIFINNSKIMMINDNNITNILGGYGGYGADGDEDHLFGGKGGDGGNCRAIWIKNSSNILNERNLITNLHGGVGGFGGTAGYNLPNDIVGCCGNGGLGGNCLGIYVEKSLNIKNVLNNISNIIGGNGGLGSSSKLKYYTIDTLPAPIPLVAGQGGDGGDGGYCSGIFCNYSKDIENNFNNIQMIIGGIGGEGGNGGQWMGSIIPNYLCIIGCNGGNGGDGGFCSGIHSNNSINLKNYKNNILEIVGNSGSRAGNVTYYPDIALDPLIIALLGLDIINFSGRGGDGGNGGGGIGINFDNSTKGENIQNNISEIIPGDKGLKGLKEPNDENSTDGLDGNDGIIYGFFLINSNESISFLNSIHCENNLDNGTNNQWNSTEYGNYWEYYEGEDLDGNNIGDSPYNLNGSAHSKDYFPIISWVKFWKIKPLCFNLSSDAGDLDDDGCFNLSWTESLNANNYSVYVYSSNITEINDNLTLLSSETTNLSLEQTDYEDGIYFFIVVAHNDFGDTLSNCLELTVEIPNPPEIFTLSSDAEDPDEDGWFNLSWTESVNAMNYTIYRSDKNITEINDNLTILAEGIKNFSYIEKNLPVGIYYYIVVAFNDFGNTSSNCIQIIVSEKPPDDEVFPPDFIIWIIIGTTSIGSIGVVSGIVVSKRKNYRKKREWYSKLKHQ